MVPVVCASAVEPQSARRGVPPRAPPRALPRAPRPHGAAFLVLDCPAAAAPGGGRPGRQRGQPADGRPLRPGRGRSLPECGHTEQRGKLQQARELHRGRGLCAHHPY